MSGPIKPTFLIIGATKAATTTLAAMLRDHSEITFSKVKEPHFFSLPQQYGKGLSWYSSLFDHHKGEAAIGEASTSYSRIRSHPRVIRRIAQHLPDVKIIYMVRHPLDRIRSAWFEWLATADFDYAGLSLEQAVKQMPMLIDSSRHFEVYEAYRKQFGEERIKIVWFDEFTKAPTSEFGKICKFLGIAPIPVPEYVGADRNDRARVIERLATLGRSIEGCDFDWTPPARAFVHNELRDDMDKFLTCFGRPPGYWPM